ncbi:MAG: hypothetical protein IIY42_06610 [Ruminococcus sp.]|uniref:hypothetical protein n=1 Tax=uncultured Ruminococcus sp. TaxID=165186 RepID=UPI00293155B0|nr:hypothetical protein [uncultured Ruminococcus sp.]MBQ1354508.1 hypothetical protein [Ruminococcus sp.]
MSEKEQKVIIECLMEKRNARLSEGRTTDLLDEIILHVCNAPEKNYKVVERSGYADAR